MTREQIKKLSHTELIKKFEFLLTQKSFDFSDAVLLQKVHEEIDDRRNEIVLGDPTVGNVGRILQPLQNITKISIPEKTVDINLIVMDKESMPEIPGLKKYSLGYALNTTKAFEGDNICGVLDALVPIEFRVGSVVTVKAKGIAPVKSGQLYGVSVDTPLTFTQTTERVNSAKEIIRKAHAAEVLALTPEVAIDLTKCGIIKMDIDKVFGIALDKQMPIIKGPSFGKHGVFYSIVYKANEKDTDGDWTDEEENQLACWKFMEEHQRLNFMHNEPLTDREVSIVECGVARVDEPNNGIRKGDWWMAVRVKDGELRKQIEDGIITGFSMEGTALPGE